MVFLGGGEQTMQFARGCKWVTESLKISSERYDHNCKCHNRFNEGHYIYIYIYKSWQCVAHRSLFSFDAINKTRFASNRTEEE